MKWIRYRLYTMRTKFRVIVLGICIVSLIWFYQSTYEDYKDKVILKGNDDDPSPPQKAEGEMAQIISGKVKSFTWEQEQKTRKDAIKRGCESLGLSKEKLLNRLMVAPTAHFKHFLVDDKRKAIYCYIPKIACTNWKRVWMVLRGLTTEKNLTAIAQLLPHKNPIKHKMELMTTTKKSELRNKLETYRKLIVVRHPFQRLASAYRSKVSNNSEEHRTFYNKLVFTYVKKHRPDANLFDIQWPEFVDFLTLGKGEKVSDHWESYQTLCDPCAIDYDVIGKSETLFEDSEKFLRLIGAPEDLHFPTTFRTSKRIDDSLWMEYQKRLNSDQLAALHKTYYEDFKLFEFE